MFRTLKRVWDIMDAKERAEIVAEGKRQAEISAAFAEGMQQAETKRPKMSADELFLAFEKELHTFLEMLRFKYNIGA